MVENEDIDDVVAEETSRGRKPIDTEERRRRKQLREDLRWVIRYGDEESFLRILREAGLKQESAEFAEALKLFHDARRR